MILYKDLDKHFTLPKVISPFYGDIRIPRKLKKKIKAYVGVHWTTCSNGQRLWEFMESSNPDYKRFLIKEMCRREEKS